MTDHRSFTYRATPLRCLGMLFTRAVYGWLWFTLAVWQRLLFRRPNESAQRVLIYRIGSIGDLIHALPAMAHIRELHPNAEITLLTQASQGESWATRLGIEASMRMRVVTYDGRGEIKTRVREVTPDALYYLPPHPLGVWRAWRDMTFFRYCGIARACGFNALTPRGWFARTLRPWQNDAPQFNRLLRAIRQPGQPDTILRLPVSHVDLDLPARYVVIAPTGKSPVQRWATERYVELGAALVKDGLEVIWVGGESDRDRLAGIDLPGTSLLGELSFSQLRIVFRKALCIVGNDSGLVHMAAFEGAPTIVVSSARAGKNAWLPFSPDGSVRVIRKDMNCEACHLRECSDTACLDLVTVQEVRDAVTELTGTNITTD